MVTDRKDEAMKQALEALQLFVFQPSEEALDYADNAIDAIREALAEQPAQQQEPVAKWMGDCIEWTENPYKFRKGAPLYTSPPASKPWVGLTEEEKMAALVSVDAETKRLPPGFRNFAHAIEDKLREKNNG